MKILELIRLEESEEGTFGILKIDKQVFCCTLEPTDYLNQTSRSSIPAQQYNLRPVNSPSKGRTWTVMNVPDRTHILFHAGNTTDHTEGCILLGSSFGKLGTHRAVLNSGNTFKQFMDDMGKDTIAHLTIREVY